MFEVGDIVKVQYGPDAGVMSGSVVWNLEGSICKIDKRFRDKDYKPYYYLSPVAIQTKGHIYSLESDMKCWWRDNFLVSYEGKSYEIDNMDVFNDEQ